MVTLNSDWRQLLYAIACTRHNARKYSCDKALGKQLATKTACKVALRNNFEDPHKEEPLRVNDHSGLSDTQTYGSCVKIFPVMFSSVDVFSDRLRDL